ncbi:MAG: glycoside hydrolase family 43 protein [Halanaerobiaceae bacterium]
MKYIENPILTGFNPDPSIVRVGDDYYIATSTFEWYPGVQIFHSRDLANWELVARPLQRESQLNMLGEKCSAGVWAPCLSYDEGKFYLVYSDVKTRSGIWKDVHNYVVTADQVTGEWSDPVYLNSSGIDPSLFHDQDGRKWLVNMIWEHRIDVPGKSGGIILQEYDPQKKKLVGPVKNIFPGELRMTEGPHLYRKDGYYHLVVAEGGTGYSHVVTMARSRSLTGPYEVHPENPVLTSRNDPQLELQKAGHADLVETKSGEWYMVHLCSRPLSQKGACPLGRETAIQKVVWKDNWLYLAEGGRNPSLKVPAPEVQEFEVETITGRDDFDSPELDKNYQYLRTPLTEETFSLTERPGYLRLKGRESLSSRYQQSLIARRWKHFKFTAATVLEFEPESYQQMAGLVCYYDEHDFYYLQITHNEKNGKVLSIISCDRGEYALEMDKEICVESWDKVYLKVEVDYKDIQFYAGKNEDEFQKIGPVLDAEQLANAEGGFTGSFVGLCCQDLTGQRKAADFGFFEYRTGD